MVLGWISFKIVSDSPVVHSRWLLLLKIIFFSIVHCSFIINQNEQKFNCSFMRRFKCESLQHMTHWWTAEAKWWQKLTWPRELIITWCVYESQSIIRRVISVSALALYNYKKGCTRLTAASNKVYQLLAHGRWISPGTPASSTTKSGCHYVAEILLKVALDTIIQSSNHDIAENNFHLALNNNHSLTINKFQQFHWGRLESHYPFELCHILFSVTI
jgi:hypothetical protein